MQTVSFLMIVFISFICFFPAIYICFLLNQFVSPTIIYIFAPKWLKKDIKLISEGVENINSPNKDIYINKLNEMEKDENKIKDILKRIIIPKQILFISYSFIFFILLNIIHVKSFYFKIFLSGFSMSFLIICVITIMFKEIRSKIS